MMNGLVTRYLSVLFTVALLTFPTPAFARRATPDMVHLVAGYDNSLRLVFRERTVSILPGRFVHRNTLFRVNEPKNFELERCPVLVRKKEPFKLLNRNDTSYFERVPVGCCAGGPGRGPVPHLIVPGTLRVEELRGRVLTPGIDYEFEDDKSCINRSSNSSVADGSAVLLSYCVITRRIDTIAVDASGIVTLFKGLSSAFAPVPPHVPSNMVPLANVFAPPGTSSIKMQDVLPISGMEIRDPETDERNGGAVRAFKRLAKTQRVLNVDFLGDSVSCGAFASDESLGFTSLFCRKLKELLPDNQINSRNFSIGGTNSSYTFDRYLRQSGEKKSDLLVVEFVNDLGLDSEVLRRNYSHLFSALRKRGTTIIVCLPHLVNPSLYGFRRCLTKEDFPYYSIVSGLARRNGVAIADVGSRWQYCEHSGLTQRMLLADDLNHPNDRGHEIYVEELLRALN